EEYLLDLDKIPGEAITDEITHLRTWQVDPVALRWPLTSFMDSSDVMAGLPSSRGTFETRGDMVEHCHLEFRGEQYLLVKQFDEHLGQVMLLGSSRDADGRSLIAAVNGLTE
ncbi:MAG: hypothetical protein O3B72_05520, partial [Proteobacteria bacterium]|nr:hypothetical protein [Pseudomonadota bacterium]